MHPGRTIWMARPYVGYMGDKLPGRGTGVVSSQGRLHEWKAARALNMDGAHLLYITQTLNSPSGLLRKQSCRSYF